MTEVEKRVKEVCEQVLGDIEWDQDLTLAELGVDSLDRGEIALELEEEFNTTITDDEAQNFVTIGDIVAYFEQ